MHTSRAVRLVLVAAVALASRATAQAPARTPTIDDLISLRRAGSPSISPDGKLVAYTVRETNWEFDAYETNIWLADAQTGVSWRLTNAKKSSTGPQWSPDGSRIAFGSDRTDKRQLYLINPRGGEAEQLTTLEESPGGFAWSPDGASIAFTSTDPRSDEDKDREKQYGLFDVVDGARRMAQLHLLDVATRTDRPLTSGSFVVGRFDWSPDGTRIAFDHRVNSDAGMSGSADISVVEVASGAVTRAGHAGGPDSNPEWSPDGRASRSSRRWPSRSTSSRTAPRGGHAGGGTPRTLTARSTRTRRWSRWTPSGIFFSASLAHLVVPLSLSIRPAGRHAYTAATTGSARVSRQRRRAHRAFVASGPREFPDVYAAPLATLRREAQRPGRADGGVGKAPARSCAGRARTAPRSKACCTSRPTFRPATPYPLLVVIHGGPTGVSRPAPYGSASFYPIDGWLAKGALVLEPNYRGSAGYGETFRSLNVRNLGIGDAWDVLSGIDHLVAQGLVDKDRVGSMGWSQGGYISAFLTTQHADRFKALSVGAGISNWVTYYVNTDIHSVHAAVPQGHAVGRPEDLRRHLADDLHQERQGADAHPAWRQGSARADPERLRAVSGTPGRGGAFDAHRL